MEFSQCLIFELFIYLFVYVSLMKSCRSRMLLGPRGRQARAELRPVRLPVTSPTLPHSRSQPAPSFLPSFPPSRPGANARSRERLGEAPPGQSGGLSAGAPRSRAPPGADLELRRPAWKLTRSFLPSPSIQARSRASTRRRAGGRAGPGTPIPLRAALAESGRPSSHTAWECGPSTGRFPSPSDRALSSLARSLARSREALAVCTHARAGPEPSAGRPRLS